MAKGAIEVMNGMNIRHVTPSDFTENYFNEAVFTQLNSRDYHTHKEGKDFHRDEFFSCATRPIYFYTPQACPILPPARSYDLYRTATDTADTYRY